jgi:hypothetical protein
MRGFRLKMVFVLPPLLATTIGATSPSAIVQVAGAAALVEDVSGVTGIGAFDYVSAGRRIALGTGGQLSGIVFRKPPATAAVPPPPLVIHGASPVVSLPWAGKLGIARVDQPGDAPGARRHLSGELWLGRDHLSDRRGGRRAGFSAGPPDPILT